MPFTECCLSNCYTTKYDVKLYNIPRNESLRGIWLSYILPYASQFKDLTPEQIVQRKVCIKHFEKRFLMGGKRTPNAYPSLMTLEEISSGVPLRSNDVESTESEEILACAECGVDIGAREMYRCVQCPLLLMCAKCGCHNAHAYHCVLRVPSRLVYDKVQNLFRALNDMFNTSLRDEDPAAAEEKLRIKREALKVYTRKTRTKAVASQSREHPAGGGAMKTVDGTPDDSQVGVKPEPDPDPLAVSPPHQSTLKRRKAPQRETPSPPKKERRKQAITDTVVSEEEAEVEVDMKMEIEVEEHELPQTDEVEVKQEPPDQDTFFSCENNVSTSPSHQYSRPNTETLLEVKQSM